MEWVCVRVGVRACGRDAVWPSIGRGGLGTCDARHASPPTSSPTPEHSRTFSRKTKPRTRHRPRCEALRVACLSYLGGGPLPWEEVAGAASPLACRVSPDTRVACRVCGMMLLRGFEPHSHPRSESSGVVWGGPSPPALARRVGRPLSRGLSRPRGAGSSRWGGVKSSPVPGTVLVVCA
jgi:hypothetical protein